MIKRVLIQTLADGMFPSPNIYIAWRGFEEERGLETGFFTFTGLDDKQVELERSTMLVGGAGAVCHALRALGVAMPAIADLPEPLAFLRGRRVWESTLGEVQTLSDRLQAPIFIKPLRDPKAFSGRVIESFRDVVSTAHLSDTLPVLVSEVVEFVSEWRFFVLNGDVIGASCYKGDPLRFPEGLQVNTAIRAWGTAAPAGYAIDLGVTSDGQTLLVEVDDGYSLGCMGLKPIAYSLLLQARWTELVQTVGVRPGGLEG